MKPYRLHDGGSRIDRNTRVTFSFDGRDIHGFRGDTLASAVLASGQKVFGRSFKYHRPVCRRPWLRRDERAHWRWC